MDLLKALLEHIKIDRVNGWVFHWQRSRAAIRGNIPDASDGCVCSTARRVQAAYGNRLRGTKPQSSEAAEIIITTIPPVYSTYFYERRLDWMKNRAKKLIPYFDRKDVQESLIRLTNSSEGYDVSDRLGEVECPTLIVNATDDVLIPLVEQTRLHEGIKNSEMVIIPKCGHASMYEKPMLFSSLVLGWINVKDEDYESIFA
ncbi:MAG: alpha/beta fold hydrolase [Christensenellales bacterium]